MEVQFNLLFSLVILHAFLLLFYTTLILFIFSLLQGIHHLHLVEYLSKMKYQSYDLIKVEYNDRQRIEQIFFVFQQFYKDCSTNNLKVILPFSNFK